MEFGLSQGHSGKERVEQQGQKKPPPLTPLSTSPRLGPSLKDGSLVWIILCYYESPYQIHVQATGTFLAVHLFSIFHFTDL